jgi:anti-sigma factor (TIGR02949 family)
MDDRRTECEAIVRRLWPFLDVKLLDSEREEVTRHLEQCSDCLSHFDFAKAFLDAVHAARPEIEDDDALRARVIAALTDQGLNI